MNSDLCLTRRTVLGAGLGLVGLIVTAGAGSVAGLLSIAPSHLAQSAYVPLVGTRFRVLSAAGSDLKLAAVRGFGALSFGGQAQMTGREHFALDFEGAGNALASSLHQLYHPELGRFQLFLTPVGQSRSVEHYEAIINRFEVNTRRRIDG